MLETIETAVYEGKIICGFPTREECKNYVKGYRTDIDPFDVQLKTQYITEYKPSGYLDR
jgi:viroplasmin and RNaseH domain-containing protein